jgi:hypothetical protein
MNGKVKLWVGVGAWVLATTSVAALTAEAGFVRTASAQTADQGGEGGEAGTDAAHKQHHSASGGEGGEGGEAGHGADPLDAAPPDVAYASRLLLIKGHLRVGRELFEAGRAKDATPHFMHPAEEIYGDLKAGLKERKVAAFKSKLDALAEAVEGNDKTAFPNAYDAALKAVDGAYAAIDAKTRESAGFAANTISSLLAVAADEYQEAVKDGRVTSPVEYQDSRGFVLEANDLYGRAKPALEAKDAEGAGRIGKALGELLPVWPAAVPPEQAVKQPGDVSALASRVALAAGDFK